MKLKNLQVQWTKKKAARSVILFFVYFLMVAGLSFALLAGAQIGNGNLLSHLKDGDWGAKYLYALCALFLIVTVEYVYFFFEKKEVLTSAKNISLLKLDSTPLRY